MQTHEKQNRRRIKTTLGLTGGLAGAALTGTALIGASPQRAAPPPSMVATDFPFTTLRATQKMHLNVTNVTQDSPDTAPACQAVFRLFDSEGRVVATATSALESGKTAQLADAPDTVPGRFQGLRGQLLVTQGRCSKSVIASMEIIDTSSGQVRAIITPSISQNVSMQDPPDTTPQ